jgi:hypothetical protein
MRKTSLLFLALCACGPSMKVVPTNAPPRELEPKPANEVAVLEAPPSRAFVETGFLEGQSAGLRDSEMLIASMREAAGRHGCDALLISGPTMVRGSKNGATWNRSGYRGSCLVFTETR